MDGILTMFEGFAFFALVVALTAAFCELLLKYYLGMEYVPPKDRTFYKNLKGGDKDADRKRAEPDRGLR